MSDADLKAQFEKISDTARTATDKVKAAGQRTRDQLEADVDSAHERATAAADRMKDKADAARDDASYEWQEIREKWHAHVAKARARAHKKKDDEDDPPGTGCPGRSVKAPQLDTTSATGWLRPSDSPMATMSAARCRRSRS